MIKINPKSFRPKWSFVKSVPARVAFQQSDPRPFVAELNLGYFIWGENPVLKGSFTAGSVAGVDECFGGHSESIGLGPHHVKGALESIL
jgi:hypothetical protein